MELMELMETLFMEVNAITTFDTLKHYKQELLKHMIIEKNKIEINNEAIRPILLYMNCSCLNKIGDKTSIIQKNGLDLFKQKNKDYGQSYKICGIVGILVRMIDKLNRLENLEKVQYYQVNESYKDTLIDLHNYSLLGIICLDTQ